jgi:hypothetical protein
MSILFDLIVSVTTHKNHSILFPYSDGQGIEQVIFEVVTTVVMKSSISSTLIIEAMSLRNVSEPLTD